MCPNGACQIPGPDPDLATYDPASDAWSSGPDAPGGRVGLAAAAWTGEQVVIVGGLRTSATPAEIAAPTPAPTLAFRPE